MLGNVEVARSCTLDGARWGTDVSVPITDVKLLKLCNKMLEILKYKACLWTFCLVTLASEKWMLHGGTINTHLLC